MEFRKMINLVESAEIDPKSRQALKVANNIRAYINDPAKSAATDDVTYNQMAELGHLLSKMGTDFGPKSLKEVFRSMQEYAEERGQEEFTKERFQELIRMASS